jgi:hypothetical protein
VLDTTEDRADAAVADLRVLLHRLNNQLGIILAHAELLEAKSIDDASRARATQVVGAAIDALMVARDLRQRATR